jgi:hypothetical protein
MYRSVFFLGNVWGTSRYEAGLGVGVGSWMNDGVLLNGIDDHHGSLQRNRFCQTFQEKLRKSFSGLFEVRNMLVRSLLSYFTVWTQNMASLSCNFE